MHYSTRHHDSDDVDIDKLQIRVPRQLQIFYPPGVFLNLGYAEGKEDELLGRIQKRTGKAKEELIDEINNL